MDRPYKYQVYNLGKGSGTKLSELPRWLVVNKVDTLTEEQADQRIQQMVESLNWQGKVYRMSAISRQGTQEICNDIMRVIQVEEAAKREALQQQQRAEALAEEKAIEPE